jgi:hypothetical protein
MLPPAIAEDCSIANEGSDARGSDSDNLLE